MLSSNCTFCFFFSFVLIHTHVLLSHIQMLNCILGMVDKTKRALAILQQRTMENAANIWTPSRNTLSSASRIIPGPGTTASAASAAQNSISSHTSNHISIPLTSVPSVVHQQQQQQSLTHKSASQSSNTISPPTVIKQITRNDIMSTSLRPQTFVEQIIPTQESSRHSSRPVVLPVTQTRGQFPCIHVCNPRI